MTEELRGEIQAVEVCIAEGEWSRAEDGLLDLLGEVRKRQSEEANT